MLRNQLTVTAAVATFALGTSTGRNKMFRQRIRSSGMAMTLMALVGVLLPLWAVADPTALTISSASVTVKGSSSTTLNFPISLPSAASYDTFLQYQTVDGTAVAGTDYTAASGSVLIPAGRTSATIPVTVAGSATTQADKSFQMALFGGGGSTFAGLDFASQQTFSTGNGPSSVIKADLNGDGLPDLIFVNSGAAMVSVRLNTTAPGATTPSYSARQNFSIGGATPAAVRVADLNGDGLPDLVVATGSGVAVLLNTTTPGAATASFAAAQTFSTGDDDLAVALADVNGDGRPDLITIRSTGDLAVRSNSTTAGSSTVSFGSKPTFNLGNDPVAMTVADLNGDGLPDIIVANQGGNKVSVLLNTTTLGPASTTTPSFATQQSSPPATSRNP